MITIDDDNVIAERNYFARCAAGVSFGRPLVRQQRNEHDLLRDFDLERLGMGLVDSLTRILADVALRGDNLRLMRSGDLRSAQAAGLPSLLHSVGRGKGG